MSSRLFLYETFSLFTASEVICQLFSGLLHQTHNVIRARQVFRANKVLSIYLGTTEHLFAIRSKLHRQDDPCMYGSNT